MKLQVQGREVYAYTGGKALDTRLPCVVFVHGALNDHSVFTLLARWWAHHGYCVLAVDLPGHARSAGPALASVEDMADWLLEFMTAAGVSSAALFGHSMGSLVALQAAANASERVTHLALVGSCVPMPVPHALLDLSLSDTLAAIDRAVMYSFSTLAAKPSYPGPGSWLRGGARALKRQVLAAQGDQWLFHTDFSACNNYAGGLAAALQVRCPAALILGQQDLMTSPKGAIEVAKRLNARVHHLPCGHYPMMECPDPVLNALRELLR